SPWNAIVSNVITENSLSGLALRQQSNGTIVTANRFLDNCLGEGNWAGELAVSNSADTMLMANLFVRTKDAQRGAPAIVSDGPLLASAVGNVFHGLAGNVAAG